MSVSSFVNVRLEKELREPVWSRDCMGFSIGVNVMPRKPKRPCSHPGCPELVEGRYCEKHQKEDYQTYNRYQRNPAHKTRYGSQWRKIRNRYIKVHPLCEKCKEQGRMKAAEEVHHVLPLEHGGTHDESNLQALCKSCHSRQSVLDGDRFRKS